MARAKAPIRAVALVFQPFKQECSALAQRVREFLTSRGADSSVLSAFDLQPEHARNVGLAITFGGDGTVLRVARWLAACGPAIPILPVRMGTLSFLGELSPTTWLEQLEPYLEGRFWLDERCMLSSHTDGTRAVALNDVMIGRGAASRAVKLDVWVNDAHVTRYVADGLILASATGSTGYALAAGGPVLAPDLQDMVLQPIAPHLAGLRSLIVPGSSVVRVAMHTHQAGELTIDGQADYPFLDGQEVTVTVAAQRTLFARRGERSGFYSNLASKLTRQT